MRRILYAGDSSLTDAASYLGGVLTHHGLRFDYVPSGQRLRAADVKGYGLYILSDYPAANLDRGAAAGIMKAVAGGAGLLMIGGWASYHGKGGNWDRSPLAEALPVRISSRDDRVNSAHPCLVEKVCDHPIVDGLPLDRPPGVGGYNRARVKAGAMLILAARHVDVRFGKARQVTATKGDAAPLLVVGQYGAGRTAAFTSDVAPHWVGGLVDWGDKRVKARAKGGSGVEVGGLYAEFFARLAKWTADED